MSAPNSAADQELALIAEAWPLLSPHRRSIIVGMARKAVKIDSSAS